MCQWWWIRNKSKWKWLWKWCKHPSWSELILKVALIFSFYKVEIQAHFDIKNRVLYLNLESIFDTNNVIDIINNDDNKNTVISFPLSRSLFKNSIFFQEFFHFMGKWTDEIRQSSFTIILSIAHNNRLSSNNSFRHHLYSIFSYCWHIKKQASPINYRFN